MDKTLAGKVAIITGAGQGIGFEICLELINAGASVVLNDVDAVLANDAVKKIQSATNTKNCIALPGDSSDMNVIRNLVDSAVEKFGHLDIAIANAGITLFGDFLTYTSEAFFNVMQVNLGGTFFLAQAAVNQMKMQGHGGSLLFTSSVTGHQAHKNLGAYGMSKAAIEMLAKNLVIEISEYNINVNTIVPGATLTARTMEDPNYQETWSALTPMRRPATVKDIAAAALFLVSDQARHITGQSLIIDGGWSSVSPSPY